MGRGRFLLWRLLLLIPTIIGLTILTFIISRVVPADPARLAAGPRATPEMVETIREKYGLNDPLVEQYFDYIRGLLHGDFGDSILTQHSVSSDLASRFPATLELVLAAMFIAVGLGVPLGVISAVSVSFSGLRRAERRSPRSRKTTFACSAPTRGGSRTST